MEVRFISPKVLQFRRACWTWAERAVCSVARLTKNLIAIAHLKKKKQSSNRCLFVWSSFWHYSWYVRCVRNMCFEKMFLWLFVGIELMFLDDGHSTAMWTIQDNWSADANKNKNSSGLRLFRSILTVKIEPKLFQKYAQFNSMYVINVIYFWWILNKKISLRIILLVRICPWHRSVELRKSADQNIQLAHNFSDWDATFWATSPEMCCKTCINFTNSLDISI